MGVSNMFETTDDAGAVRSTGPSQSMICVSRFPISRLDPHPIAIVSSSANRASHEMPIGHPPSASGRRHSGHSISPAHPAVGRTARSRPFPTIDLDQCATSSGTIKSSRGAERNAAPVQGYFRHVWFTQILRSGRSRQSGGGGAPQAGPHRQPCTDTALALQHCSGARLRGDSGERGGACQGDSIRRPHLGAVLGRPDLDRLTRSQPATAGPFGQPMIASTMLGDPS